MTSVSVMKSRSEAFSTSRDAAAKAVAGERHEAVDAVALRLEPDALATMVHALLAVGGLGLTRGALGACHPSSVPPVAVRAGAGRAGAPRGLLSE